MATATPGRTPPPLSVIVPEIVAVVSCARTSGEPMRRKATNANSIRFIGPPPAPLTLDHSVKMALRASNSEVCERRRTLGPGGVTVKQKGKTKKYENLDVACRPIGLLRQRLRM